MTTNKRMVELDAVDKLLKKVCHLDVSELLETLPSIPNPIELIEKEIIALAKDTSCKGEDMLFKLRFYEELLSKLKS